jgi:hypothetical protein
MTTRWLNCGFAFALSILSACGGGDEDAGTVEPLPIGSGLYFTDGISGFNSANFYRVDTVSGDTALQRVGAGADSPGITQCPAIAALDVRPDGMVLAVALRTAVMLEADARSTLCRQLAPLPEVMRAVAVRADGRIHTVSTTNKLYQLDAQGRVLSSAALLCASFAPTCPVTGMDFGPNGTLHAIVSGGLWSRIDPASGQLTTVKTGVGLSDDFDIDALGQVRGLAGGELRSIDVAGNPTGHAINVFGGTAFATGVVYR